VLKAHILSWQYFQFKDIQDTLVIQVKRIEDKFRSLEDTEIQANIGDKFKTAYIPQGLADLWKAWVRSEYDRVQTQVLKFLKTWAQKGRDLNRPDDKDVKLLPGEAKQPNKDIVEIFELYLKTVNELQPWNIEWDEDSNGDPMDTS
jgi:hypothetical protein